MTPLPGAGHEQARILEYWRAVEMFSPQNVPRLNPASRIGAGSPGGRRCPASVGSVGLVSTAGSWTPVAVHCVLRGVFVGQAAGPARTPVFDGTADLVRPASRGRKLPLCGSDYGCGASTARYVRARIGALGGGPVTTFRIRETQPGSRGFETAAAEQALRFAERFAVRENDEIGRKLLEKGWDVGRPFSRAIWNSKAQKWRQRWGSARLFGRRAPGFGGDRYWRNIHSNPMGTIFSTAFSCAIWSVWHRQRLRGTMSAALARFLTPDADLALERRRDVRMAVDLLWKNSAPSLIPRGRWPAPASQSLYFSQQFAINSAFQSFDSVTDPLFAINGPPGTGKTTLLREVTASVVVRRAQALADVRPAASCFRREAGILEHGRTAPLNSFVAASAARIRNGGGFIE